MTNIITSKQDNPKALARALRNFRGGCVVVTHNEKFIDEAVA